MATVKDILSPYLLTDASLPTDLINDLGTELYRPPVTYTNATSTFNNGYSTSVSFDFYTGYLIKPTSTFLKNLFGPALRDIFITVYPTSAPAVVSPSVAEAEGVMIVSFGNRYDDIYRRNIGFYSLSVDQFYSLNGIANTQNFTFPFATAKTIARVAEINGDLVIPVVIRFTENTVESYDTSKYIYLYDVQVLSPSDFEKITTLFEANIPAGSSLLKIEKVALPVQPQSSQSSSPTISDIDYDLLIYGAVFTVSDGTNTITSHGMVPLSIRFDFVGKEYNKLWDDYLLSENVAVLSPSMWPNPILDTTTSTYLSVPPLIDYVNRLSEDYRFYVESFQSLFFVLPEFRFPVDPSLWTTFHDDIKEAIANTSVDIDVLFFPSTEGTSPVSTTDNWVLYATSITPTISEAAARFVLYGPLVQYGDGSLASPEMTALRSILSNFEQTPHLPPAGIPRGVVGGAVTTYPFLNQFLGDAQRFLDAHINPVLQTSPGGEFAIMGNFTLYSDESSYKSRVDTMILSRLIKRVIISAFSGVIFNSPHVLSDTAREVVRRVSSIPGVALFEVASLSYDATTRTGTVEFNLFFEGVVEQVIVTVNIGMGSLEVVL